MWFVSTFRKWRARRAGPAFDDLSREDQVEVMRNREAGPDRHASREGAKHHGSEFFGNRFGGGGS